MICYYLKNKNDLEIVDVMATSLEEAKVKAALYMGGLPNDWIERF